MNNDEYDYPQDPKIKGQESVGTVQAGYQQGSDPNLIAHQLDPNPVLQPLWHSLNGDIWNESKQLWEDGSKYGVDPCINVQGINFIINKIRLRFNHFTSLSNMDEETIWQFKEECEHDTNEILFEKGDVFEVEASMKSNIINDVGQAVLIGLNRAKNQGERVFLAKTLESKQVFQTREPEKKGIRKVLHL